MARLDRSARQQLADDIRKNLPDHWVVRVGQEGQAYIEVDQDGLRSDCQFPTVGSSVIVVENNPEKGSVVAMVFKRVRCPPGFTEGREYIGVQFEGSGRGWQKRLADDIGAFAIDLEKET